MSLYELASIGDRLRKRHGKEPVDVTDEEIDQFRAALSSYPDVKL